MNRKNNPMLSLVALVLLAIILTFACIGCTAASAATDGNDRSAMSAEPTKEAKAVNIAGTRFTVEFSAFGWPYMEGIYVITDTETGVQYLYCETDRGCGLCKLED